jgi:hypothetical protein
MPQATIAQPISYWEAWWHGASIGVNSAAKLLYGETLGAHH